MTLQIERVRKYIVGQKPPPGRPHHIYEQNQCGVLVTGYEDGSDWLVSPLGRSTWGKILRDRPNTAWAISADRRDYHRLHFYILDLKTKSFEAVSGLKLTRDFDLIQYDRDRLVVICPRAGDRNSLVREIFVLDVASARIADRFILKGFTHSFRHPIGCGPDGRITIYASRLGEEDERLYIHGIARIHPLTRDVAFEVFPADGYGHVLISPSGQYVLKARKTVRSVVRPSASPIAAEQAAAPVTFYERALELWVGSPLAHVRDLPLEWENSGGAWKLPSIPMLVWQPDEAAFWWVEQHRAMCIGLDGTASPAWRLNTHRSICTALPGRVAEFVEEQPTHFVVIRLDGSPSGDLSPKDAPAATVITPSNTEQKRHNAVQAALTKIVRAKSDLTFSVKTSEPADIVGAIDAITAAIERGLGWFASEEGIVKLSVKIAGVAHAEKPFFDLVEKLGVAVAPSLARLVAKCRMDPDLPTVWSGALEDGHQALGAAARALAGIDAGAWPELAAYEMCIDEWHELYFRNEVLPHFIKSHGWREESFALAIADIVQVRGNLGDDFASAWRRSGLSAAAETACSPVEFSKLMLSIRDRMLASAAGSFATFAARVAAAPSPVHGWCNYDRLFEQIGGATTSWEVQLFKELQQSDGKSGCAGLDM